MFINVIFEYLDQTHGILTINLNYKRYYLIGVPFNKFYVIDISTRSAEVIQTTKALNFLFPDL